MKKELIDVLFILGMATVLIILMQFISPHKYIAFSFLPVLFAYWMGQWVQRKFSKKKETTPGK